MFRIRKVGHAGTLDPMATGLLILCTGKRTRDVQEYMGLEKEYEGEMELGGVTASFDAETPVLERKSLEGLLPERVIETFRKFQGPQEQLPPMYSAVKREGKRLYEYARKGVEVERAPRQIQIYRLDVARCELPRVAFSVVCSKGTYVRSLVHDIGTALGCGGYLTALRRTRIGSYHVRDAATIEELSGLRELDERK